MGLISLLSACSPNRVFVAIVLGALGGVGNALLIPLLLASIDETYAGGGLASEQVRTVMSVEVASYKFGLLYLAICALILLARTASEILLSRVALDATAELRGKIYETVARAPIAQLERHGPSKIIAVITTDVNSIIMGATSVPAALASVITLVAIITYLFINNIAAGRWLIAAIVLGIATYQVPMLIARGHFERRRLSLDALHEAIRGLLLGAKELKLSEAKKEHFFARVLLENERAVLHDTRRGYTFLTLAQNYGALLNFLVIGVLAFVFVRYHATTKDEMLAMVMSLFYLIGPVALILDSLSVVTVGAVSLRTVQRTFAGLAAEQASMSPEPVKDWDMLRLTEATYAYSDAPDAFRLSPTTLDLRKGEITFIVGGNGSGKSTLGKLISLHYVAPQGEMYFGRVKVGPQSIQSCRERVSAIFSDYYLFDRLLCDLDSEGKRRAERYLAELGLEGKVTIDDRGRFSTIALSDGQRKRLALLVALLEDKDLYVFDEWAADQDPVFKAIFYELVLSELKARHKAVVVITHDDRYFQVADKIAVMEDGRLVRVDASRARFGSPQGGHVLPMGSKVTAF